MLRRHWPLLALLCAITLAFYPLVGGQFFSTGDVRDVFIPLEHFFQQEQLQGRLPLWHPDAAWGFPVMAAAQIGFFYPPLVLARALPMPVYLSLLFIGHLILTAAGMYYLLRHQGLSRASAYLGASSFTLGSFLIEHTTHLNIIFGVAWLPWQLLVARQLATRRSLRLITLFALTTSLPFLAGQLQVPLFMAVVSSCYVLYLSQRQQQSLPRAILALSVAGTLALGISAVQLLPTIELVQYSSRGTGGDFDLEQANQYSFAPYHLPSTLFPRFFGNDTTYWGKRLEIEYGVFIGTIPLLLALTLGWRSLPERRFWITLAIVSFVLALGQYSPLRLVGFEPSFWIFTAPARWLLFTMLAASLCAAHGFERLSVREHHLQFKKVARLAVVIIGSASVGWTILLTATPPARTAATVVAHLSASTPALVTGRPAAYYEAKVAQLITSARDSTISLASPYTLLPLIAGALAALSATSARGRNLLLIVTTAELVLVAATTSPTAPWRDLLTPPATIEQLPASIRAKEARLTSVRPDETDTGKFLTNPASRPTAETYRTTRALIVPLLHAQFNLPGIMWPASLNLAEQYNVLRRLRQPESYHIADLELARDLNIGAIISEQSPKIPPHLTASYQDETLAIYPLDAAPRAEVITTSGHHIPVPYHAPTPSTVDLTFTTPEPGTLLVRDTWYPGWTATLDGQPVTIEKSHDIFRAVAVPAGSHTVVFTYQPVWLNHGLVISIITTILCGSILVGLRWPMKPLSSKKSRINADATTTNQRKGTPRSYQPDSPVPSSD